MNKNDKGKNQKQVIKANPLESLKDIAGSTAKQMRQEAAKMPQDIMQQMFGVARRASYSGEIVPGETLEVRDVFSGKQVENDRLKKQVAFERRLRKLMEEEGRREEKKKNELKIQLSVIQKEIVSLAEKTEGLAEETEIAVMQAPVEPGVYHVIFFEKLFEFIKSFKKKIEEASVWLHAVNARAAKKNAWGANYKKHGAKYLLSGEHYLSRSAG
jgi:hypothetical protein